MWEDERAVCQLCDSQSGAEGVACVGQPIVDQQLLEREEALATGHGLLAHRLLIVEAPQPLLAQPVLEMRLRHPVCQHGVRLDARRRGLRSSLLEVLQTVWEEGRRQDTPARALDNTGVHRVLGFDRPFVP